jgi:hypothetical protein
MATLAAIWITRVEGVALLQTLDEAHEFVLVRSEVFGIDIKLEANKLEAAGVYGEATLKVRIQYLRGGTFLGDGTQDELDNHDRGVADTGGRGWFADQVNVG